MEDLKKQSERLLNDVNSAVEELGVEMALQTRDKIRKRMKDPSFWSSPEEAQEESKHENRLTKKYEPWLEIKKTAQDLVGLADLSDATIQTELSSQIDLARAEYERLKKDLKFQGPYDDHNVVLSIYAGAGGTDAQDWARMLERMYLRYAESQKLNAKVVDESAGEEAGIKSATLELAGGNFLYGKLAGEHGVHRLVRLSPFNAGHKRQTSFAKVDVLPLIDQPSELEIDEKDLKIDVFRAGGHGGQSVNTTDSAVRVTHVPTGITVAIQNERSQLQNKETALSILRSKLVQLQLEQHAKNLSELKGPSQKNEWGSQIRSYVLHPYKQVKDLRTGYTSSDPEKILNGDLDDLIST